MFDDRREEIARVHEALQTAGLVAPLDLDDPEDVRRWVHCDLASMVEGCFDVRLDPLALGQAERDAWLGRLGGSYRLPDPCGEDTGKFPHASRPRGSSTRRARGDEPDDRQSQTPSAGARRPYANLTGGGR